MSSTKPLRNISVWKKDPLIKFFIFVKSKKPFNMKKTFLFYLLPVVFVFLFTMAFRPVNASVSSSRAEGNPELPDSVLKVVQKACMDCHADGGNGMAKSHVDFSKWNTYDAKKQADKAADISNVLSKGSMPPGKWRKNNPDKIPAPAEVELIRNWAKTLNK